MPQNLVIQIILGTTPLLVVFTSVLGVIIWNLIELKSFKAEIRIELSQINQSLTNIKERLATLEERDRGKN